MSPESPQKLTTRGVTIKCCLNLEIKKQRRLDHKISHLLFKTALLNFGKMAAETELECTPTSFHFHNESVPTL